VPEGDTLAVETSRGERVCLVNCGGAIHAIANNCTHQDFPMSDGFIVPREGRCIIECAWHGAQYDVVTGKVLKEPAEIPIATYAVRIDGGRVLVGPRK
jgi:3-phenylpropionate/trans-cinnamate dioxygenase ferredoxin subunit